MNKIAFLQTYQKIQQEIIDLTYNITFCDNQFNISSAYIADLILRIASEIESVAKTICREANRHEDGHKFDYDCIELIIGIENAFGVIMAPSMYFEDHENRVYFPFRKTEQKFNQEDENRRIYSWDNAYQALKHDKLAHISEFATIKYLLSAFSALTILLHVLNNQVTSDIIALPDDNGRFWKPSAGSIVASLPNDMMEYIHGEDGHNIR